MYTYMQTHIQTLILKIKYISKEKTYFELQRRGGLLTERSNKVSLGEEPAFKVPL